MHPVKITSNSFAQREILRHYLPGAELFADWGEFGRCPAPQSSRLPAMTAIAAPAAPLPELGS